MHDLPKIYKTGRYFRYLLRYYNVEHTLANNGRQYKFTQFKEYNYLVDLNSIFSNRPSGDITDRTQTINMPYKMAVMRPWQVPGSVMLLNDIFETRVHELEKLTDKINIFWSGGIDSTAILVAVLKHGDLSKYNVLYTADSVSENPNFYLLLKNKLTLVDIADGGYQPQNLTGIFVTGAGGDGLMASLDESFVDKVGYYTLNQPWQDYFVRCTDDINFLNFCEEFFKLAGRPINTLLEARWWFYTSCKLQKFPAGASDLVSDHQVLVQGFFDTAEFESYNYFNIDRLMPKADYTSYKQDLKDYIFAYWPDIDYYKNKIKSVGYQLRNLNNKRFVLTFSDYLMMLDNGERVRTPNLPLFGSKEFQNTYGNRFDYLFCPD